MPDVFVTQYHRLVIRSWNSLSGLVLLVVGRIRDDAGRIRSFQFTFTPNTDRSVLEYAYDLSRGLLLDVAVTPQAGVPRRGQCYVTLGLALGDQPTTAYYADLAKGYVTSNGGLLWPGGPYLDSVHGPGLLRSVAGTDQAAGTDVVEAVPANARWRFRSLRATLVTDATVATRNVDFFIDDGTTTLIQFPSVTGQTATTTIIYTLAEYGFTPTASSVRIYFALPLGIYLFQGWRVLTLTALLKAGDNWGVPQMQVEEWIEE